MQAFTNCKCTDISGRDDALLKRHKEVFYHIYNKQSIEESTFPIAFKTAVITSVLKSGDQTSLCSYRPINVLPVVSTVVEKVTAKQLKETSLQK